MGFHAVPLVALEATHAVPWKPAARRCRATRWGFTGLPLWRTIQPPSAACFLLPACRLPRLGSPASKPQCPRRRRVLACNSSDVGQEADWLV
jgi:hypothetical protein